MRIGLHVSIAGNISESLGRAKGLGCNTMQIFSRNPRGWQVSPIAGSESAAFRSEKKALDITPVVVHIPYIINLATPDPALYKRSIEAYVEDLRRADELGAEYFVTHLGSHVGSGEKAGIERFIKGLNTIIRKADVSTMILLETTAGSGSSLGSRFEEIGQMIRGLDRPERCGVCVDTAHIFASGYELRTEKGFKKTMKELDSSIGTDKVKVIHFNDSKAEFGSKVDRHEHLGKGKIGLPGLARVINHKGFRDCAFIMETPKEDDSDDKKNMKIARKMCGDI